LELRIKTLEEKSQNLEEANSRLIYERDNYKVLWEKSTGILNGEEKNEESPGSNHKRARESNIIVIEDTPTKEQKKFKLSEKIKVSQQIYEIEEYKESQIKLQSLQQKEQSVFKYDEPVRKKKERQLLKGKDCPHCQKFYDAIQEGGQHKFDRGKFVAECSKHKQRFTPPSTPPNYWDLGFPGDNNESPKNNQPDQIVVNEDSQKY